MAVTHQATKELAMAFGPLVQVYPDNSQTEEYRLTGKPLVVTPLANGAAGFVGVFRSYGAKSALLEVRESNIGMIGIMLFYLNDPSLPLGNGSPEIMHRLASVAPGRDVLYTEASVASAYRQIVMSSVRSSQLQVALLPCSNQTRIAVYLINLTGGIINGVTVNVALSQDEVVEPPLLPVDSTSLADLAAMSTYLPGYNSERFAPVTPGSAVPALVAWSAAGGYYGVSVDPLTGPLEARMRLLSSTPVPIVGTGLTSMTFNNGSATVAITGTASVNVVPGQLVFAPGTGNGPAFATRVTNVAAGGPGTLITLATTYAGATYTGATGYVCGLASAAYPNIVPQSSNAGVVEFGPLATGDVILGYADAAFAAAVVQANRVS